MQVGESAKRIIRYIGKRKNFGVPPEIGYREVIIHPLPNELSQDADRFFVGQEVVGRYGEVHTTGKTDSTGREILVQYFIPMGLLGEMPV